MSEHELQERFQRLFALAPDVSAQGLVVCGFFDADRGDTALWDKLEREFTCPCTYCCGSGFVSRECIVTVGDRDYSLGWFDELCPVCQSEPECECEALPI